MDFTVDHVIDSAILELVPLPIENATMIRFVCCLIAVLVIIPCTVRAQTSEAIEFGRQIQPILAKRCYACHGPDKAEGGLRLNQKALAFEKLESGKQAIVPKDPSHSEILRRILSKDESEQMPPEGPRLTDIQIELLKKWIEQGKQLNKLCVIKNY